MALSARPPTGPARISFRAGRWLLGGMPVSAWRSAMAAAALARIARSCGWTGLVEEGHPDHFAGPWLEAGHHRGADPVVVPYHAAGQQRRADPLESRRWQSAAAVQCQFFAPHPAGPSTGEGQHRRRLS